MRRCLHFPWLSFCTVHTAQSSLASFLRPRHLFHLISLAVCLGRIVTLVHDQVLWSVVFLAAEVRLEDVLHTGGVALLRIDRGTRHVWHGGVASAPSGVLGVTQRVFLWSGLWEPHITSIATELAALESLSNVLLYDNGTTGCVDEPCTW